MISLKIDKCFKSEKKEKQDNRNYKVVTNSPISVFYHLFKNYLQGMDLQIVWNLPEMQATDNQISNNCVEISIYSLRNQNN